MRCEIFIRAGMGILFINKGGKSVAEKNFSNTSVFRRALYEIHVLYTFTKNG